MAERTVKANGIEIWTQEFGDPADPPILLIMGAGGQGIMWPEEFCQRLVVGKRYVIRYDNRDTGRSTCFDFSRNPYTISDMARDAVGVLDAYSLPKAHVVGASMGGMICQALAIEHPDRILTMTSIMSSPAGGQITSAIANKASAGALPPPEPKVIEAVQAAVLNPPGTREERIDQQLRMFRALSGSLAPFDEAGMRERFERAYDRASNPAAANNHTLAIGASADRSAALAQVTAPALVIHGTADPILPYPHGVATARAIPGAELMTIEKMGHELPEVLWPRITEAILRHTSRIPA